ncbi:MAG: hypothetical protein ACI9TH_000386 [Kiritimatiellia bacterium]|jgi:hypothetical protein
MFQVQGSRSGPISMSRIRPMAPPPKVLGFIHRYGIKIGTCAIPVGKNLACRFGCTEKERGNAVGCSKYVNDDVTEQDICSSEGDGQVDGAARDFGREDKLENMRDRDARTEASVVQRDRT